MTMYCPPTSFYSQVSTDLADSDMHKFVGKNGAHLKYLTDKLNLEYIWWAKERGVIELWGPHSKLANAQQVMEQKLQKYVEDKNDIVIIVDALKKSQMLIAIGPKGNYLKELKNELNLKKIWWNQNDKTVEATTGNAREAVSIRNKLNDFLTNVEIMHPVANVNAREYISNYVSVKQSSSPGSVIYDVVGKLEDCLKFFEEEESKYPSNPYFTKIIKTSELDNNENVLMTIRRSDTSD